MIQKKVLWLAVASGTMALTGSALNRGLDRAWRLATREDPPADPASPDVSWREAILWTVATSVVIGLGRLMVRRSVAAGWELVTGEDPPA